MTWRPAPWSVRTTSDPPDADAGVKLAVLSTGRQDWGILHSTCTALSRDSGFDLCLLIGGMHLSGRFGRTIDLIEAEGFRPAERLGWLSNDGREPAMQQAGRALELVGAALERTGPDALLLVGDRFEVGAAAVAATLARVPIVHLHGGEETEGAFDNALRHAITKLAHLHLVSHPEHRARVIALGEDPATVHVVGAPGADNANRDDLPTRADLEASLGIPLVDPVVLVTLHPSTLGTPPEVEADAVARAMERVEATYVVTLPNADPGNEVTRSILEAAIRTVDGIAIEALGERRYWGLLKIASALLGNSSSALIEGPVLRTPAVNVGRRQHRRVRGANVIDVVPEAGAIERALSKALSAEFRISIERVPSPFGDGNAAARIVEVLQGWTPPRPPVKPPVDVTRVVEAYEVAHS